MSATRAASGAAADELIYRIGHDLRASLRALRELPDWIDEDLRAAGHALPETAVEALHLLQAHAGRLDRMVTGLAAYARLAQTPRGSGGDAAKALASNLAEAPDRLAVRVRLCRNRPAMDVEALRTAFGILIDNALEAASGPRRLLVASRVAAQNWVLDIHDDGPGIPANCRQRVLKPLEKLTPRDADGRAGMGLAILDRMVALHGGSVEIRDPGRRGGTWVRVVLPLAGRDAEDFCHLEIAAPGHDQVQGLPLAIR